MRRVSASTLIDMATAQFASELDESTRMRLERGRILSEILKQGELEPIAFEKQVVLIFGGTNGFFDGIPTSEVSEFSKKFLDYVEKMHSEAILHKIKSSGEMSDEVAEKLKKAIEDFKKLA